MSRFSATTSHRAGKDDAEFKRDYHVHVRKTDGSGSDVAVESCEFWAAFVEADLEPESVNILREFTPHLIPVLLTNMAYEEDDEEVLQAEEDELNADRPDRDQDIKPTFRSQKDKSFGEGNSGDDEDYDDDDEDWTWNLRKSSASGLDTLSLHFGDDLLQIMLPVVEQRLADQNWRIRESAILALGAVAEGCTNGLAQYLPQLVGFIPNVGRSETFSEINDVLDVVPIFSVVVSIRHAG